MAPEKWEPQRTTIGCLYSTLLGKNLSPNGPLSLSMDLQTSRLCSVRFRPWLQTPGRNEGEATKLSKPMKVLGKAMRHEQVRDRATSFFNSVGRRLRDPSPLRIRRRTMTVTARQSQSPQESAVLFSRHNLGRSGSDPGKRRSEDLGRYNRRSHQSRFSLG
jgi:hypothetical protein